MKTIKEQMAERVALDYEAQRKAQFEADQLEMVRSLDPLEFKKLKLRWGMAPPPGGWNDTATIMKAIHMQRIVMKALEMDERMKSVRFILAAGLKLPPQVLLQGDAMTGKLADVA